MRRRRSSNIHLAGIPLLVLFGTTSFVASVTARESGAWPHTTYYTVVARPGETLTSLSARYGVSAADVAKLNRLNLRDHLTAGNVLRIPAGSGATRQAVLAEALDRSAPNYAPPPKSFGAGGHVPGNQAIVARETPARFDAVGPNHNAVVVSRHFAWPVRGPVISVFGPSTNGERNDGINIAAMLGAPIHAAAAGTVTYAGDELKGYGNLILIAHSGGYITAYAHAESITVARGDRVEKGQIIGMAGETGGVDRPQLHFEIREGLKPVDPVRLLAALP